MDRWQDFMLAATARVDQALDHYLPPADQTEAVLHQAMRYSVFAGGKRLRPVLMLAVADACRLSWDAIMPAAAALEMVHTYSLIHDDLPALDNDDYRRGKLTNHKVYGEAMALLAGDALLTFAFETLLLCPVACDRLIAMQRELARASGPAGMIGGQVGDMLAEGHGISRTALQSIHARKTGALLTAAARLPLLASGCDEQMDQVITTYAQAIGLAFQVQDDILDVAGDPQKLGKATGADAAHDKATFPALIGMEASRQLVTSLTDRAVAAVLSLPSLEATRLVQLANYLGARDH